MFRNLPAGFIRVAGTVVDSYAPQLCLFCDQPSHRAEPVCDVCRAALVRNSGACPRCALPDCAGAPCPACQRHPPPLRIIAPFVYERALAFLLRRWKYDGDRRLVAAAALLALTCPPLEAPRQAAAPAGVAGGRPQEPERSPKQTLQAALAASGAQSLALPTPLHWRRRLRRGFNQSEDLLSAAKRRCPALALACERAQSVRLLRRRATPRQTLATRKVRLHNLKGAFAVQGDVTDRPILLVDDVCTTGATGAAMATALHAAGAGPVTLWCLARTPER